MTRGALLLTLALGCAHPAKEAEAAAPGLWDYRVIYAGGDLRVTAHLPGSDLIITEDQGAHVHDLKGATKTGDDSWRCASPCTLTYEFELEKDETFLPSTPDLWLIRPAGSGRGSTYQLEMVMPPGVAFATGITPGPAKNTYRAPAADMEDGPYSAFGPFDLRAMSSSVTLALPRGIYRDAEVTAWAARAIDGVTQYYGHFPVPNAAILVLPGSGDEVSSGTARGGGGAAVQVMLGRKITEDALHEDWILVHELLHLGFPNLPKRQEWWEEGLATYLECIVRERLGITSEEHLWRELAGNLPRGLEDGALNRSGSWASTYWGGAAFSFLADVMIRERTQGRRSLEDAVRAIVAAGGNINESWSPELVIATADRATGVPVFAELWAQLAENDAPKLGVEDALKKLGVTGKGLDDRAPWASIRKAMGQRFPRPQAQNVDPER